MLVFVEDVAADHAPNFIDRVGELQAAILDMHARIRMRKIAPIDIGDAACWRARWASPAKVK